MFTLPVKDADYSVMHSDSMETMGQRIRMLRQSRSMSQDDLAKICGVSRNAVSQWESDTTTDIKLQPFLRLYAALGTSPQYLVFGADTIPRGGRGAVPKIAT